MATGAIIGIAYSIVTGGTPTYGACIGAAILGGITVFEQYYVQQRWGEWLRRSSLLVFVSVSAVVWTVLILLSLYLIPGLLGSPPGWFAERFAQGAFTTDMTFSAVVALLLNTAMRLRTLVGGRVLINFLSGQYRHPIEEERIFLFLDLIGSTTIAEQLGPVRYHAFLRDFIETIEISVHNFGGEIYQYVGDEVVTTWPVRDSRVNGRAVACHFAMVDAIERRKTYFERKYAAVPAFSSGIHCGEVIAGEIGDQRKQIVFVGDVVNTASRIQAQARAHGRGLMLSETLLSRIELPVGVQAKELGMIALKGKVEPVELFEAVDRREAIPASAN
ncbi:MAG: adenylate/guanylate cyclase domain-containing protein [Burkholderiaceae bacterium]